MANRTRPIIMRLAVTEYEKELIEKKMQQLGTKNFGAYARKMLIDGYIIKVDYTQQKKLAAAVSRVASNINQICRRINSTGHFYADDIAELKERQGEKRIVLTHNTDLIRLLDGQHKHCFKLYLLNNTDGEVNGFIPLRNREQDMLISLEKLLDAFRTDVPRKVQNVELYLISVIPFMRGYANIANKKDIFEALTQVMHGYKSESVDIAQAYIELFGNPDNIFPANYSVCVPDILLKSVDAVTIVDPASFPLLNRTLKHSFQYLYLRLAVEKALVDKFNINTDQNTQLGQIISAAFPDDNDIEQIRNRIRLTSKKTLINEFNHFEGNLSIFQPAIDITDHALSTERANLMNFIESLQEGEQDGQNEI